MLNFIMHSQISIADEEKAMSNLSDFCFGVAFRRYLWSKQNKKTRVYTSDKKIKIFLQENQIFQRYFCIATVDNILCLIQTMLYKKVNFIKFLSAKSNKSEKMKKKQTGSACLKGKIFT
jgi:hypothetical protein